MINLRNKEWDWLNLRSEPKSKWNTCQKCGVDSSQVCCTFVDVFAPVSESFIPEHGQHSLHGQLVFQAASHEHTKSIRRQCQRPQLPTTTQLTMTQQSLFAPQNLTWNNWTPQFGLCLNGACWSQTKVEWTLAMNHNSLLLFSVSFEEWFDLQGSAKDIESCVRCVNRGGIS